MHHPARMRSLSTMMCTCFGSRTTDKDDDRRQTKIYVQDVARLEPGSIHSSLRGFHSYSSQDYETKPPGAETFAMADLARATSNFSPSNKIGQGGFGMVYKGRLRDGRLVAIKRGKKDAFEQRLSLEFRTEVEMLSQVRVSSTFDVVRFFSEFCCRAMTVSFLLLWRFEGGSPEPREAARVHAGGERADPCSGVCFERQLRGASRRHLREGLGHEHAARHCD